MTGNPALDFVLEAGPRALTPLVPASVRLELSKSSACGPYKEALKSMAQNQMAMIHHDIRVISQMNKRIERKAIKGGIGVLKATIPLMLIEHFKMLYGDECWPDEDFIEDVLKHHPGLRVNTTRNEKGNEWRK